uniref:Uncharacterized protein n=1 Tax=Leersia perrieri TaxID=77586 RepID=A0A0D9WXN0_9ORYZ
MARQGPVANIDDSAALAAAASCCSHCRTRATSAPSCRTPPRLWPRRHRPPHRPQRVRPGIPLTGHRLRPVVPIHESIAEEEDEGVEPDTVSCFFTLEAACEAPFRGPGITT